MSAPSSDREPVERLAEEFAERYRRGERPSLTEYVQRYPDLAGEIRELFPALVLMEQFGSVAGAPLGPDAGTVAGDGARPQQLGEYRILREVGRGGMGVVYEAVQESLGRHVALKVLPASALLNPTYLERFRREAKAAARLHHSNIVPVFGTGAHAGIHYYAMQFIHGQGLDAVLHELKLMRSPPANAPPRASPLTASIAEALLTGCFQPGEAGNAAPGCAEEQPGAAPAGSHGRLASQTETQYYRSVAQVGVQVAEALAYAHQQGVLHRDVKPANLLLDTRGTLWLTDFGLAKAEGTDELTSPGDIVGTIRYMAPERLRGQADPRSDLYSLGTTLYELLTLCPAFDDSNRARLIERISHDDPPRPRKLDARIPRDLETIVLKAIAREPADRYPSAAALAEDLRRFLTDRPIQARRSSWTERAWRWCRRNPVVAGLTTALVSLLMVVAVGATLIAVSFQQQLGRAEEAEQATRLEQHRAAYRSQARGSRESGRSGQRFDSLQALAQAARIRPDLPLRNEVIASLVLADLRPTRQWDVEAPADFGVAFTSQLETWAGADGGGDVTVYRSSDGGVVARLRGPGKTPRAVSLRFGPDDRLLCACFHFADSEIRHVVWDVTLGKEVLTAPGQPGCRGMDFSPDGRWLAVAGGGGVVTLHGLGKHRGEVKRLGTGPPAALIAFRPDGRQLAAVARDDRVVQVFDVGTGAGLVPFPPQAALIHSLAWSHDGRLLAAGCANARAPVWEAATRRLISDLEGQSRAVHRLAFHPASELLATGSRDGSTWLWDPVRARHRATAPGCCLRFSRDGRHLAFREKNKVGLWEVADGRECRILHDGLVGNRTGWQGYFGPFGVDVSPDGRLVASASPGGVRLWDLAGARELARLPTRGVCDSARFHPNGGSLLTHCWAGIHLWPVASTPGEGKTAGLRVGRPGNSRGRATCTPRGSAGTVPAGRSPPPILPISGSSSAPGRASAASWGRSRWTGAVTWPSALTGAGWRRGPGARRRPRSGT
jgi:serine/threonine protein kinase/WD40 repeat protein